MILLLACFGLGLLALSALRQIGTYGVESDFYGVFVPEGERILAGESLKVAWHPPFYPLVLAGIYCVVGDWFRAGLLISIISSLCAIGAVYLAFRALFDRFAAAGAVIAFVAWPEFLVYSITASSDVLFLSLMMLSIAAAVTGERLSNIRALLAGIFAGLASLTRTNGVTLALVALVCAGRASTSKKAKAGLVSSAGFGLPWLIWLLASRLSGSPMFPTENYIDMAVAFFGQEGFRTSSNSDNWSLVGHQFSSFADVILHDPQTVILGFFRNLGTHWYKIFLSVHPLAFPLAVVAFLSLVYLVVQKPNGVRAAFWVFMCSQYAVLGLRSFGSRYYLFLIPAFGAGAVCLARRIIDACGESRRGKQLLWSGVIVGSLVPLAIFDGKYVSQFIGHEPKEVIEAGRVLRKIATRDETVMARKPHLAFHAGVSGDGIPPVGTTEELQRAVCSRHRNSKTFLFFGEAEASLRPGLRALRSPEDAPDWLVPLGHGSPPGSSWALYQVKCTG